eukprot:6179701-Pleurochrysis_carterae.AAC.2
MSLKRSYQKAADGEAHRERESGGYRQEANGASTWKRLQTKCEKVACEVRSQGFGFGSGSGATRPLSATSPLTR